MLRNWHTRATQNRVGLSLAGSTPAMPIFIFLFQNDTIKHMSVQQKLKEITDKIVKEYKPEKIILFDSYAWGKPQEWSDIDLFVVKKQKNPWKSIL